MDSRGAALDGNPFGAVQMQYIKIMVYQVPGVQNYQDIFLVPDVEGERDD